MYKENYNLAALNTFQVDCIASKYFKFDSDADIHSFLKNETVDISNMLILGGGSNILLVGDYPGIVFHPSNEEIELISGNSEFAIVRAGAGLEWDKFVETTVCRGWGGLENLTLIPGNVGASPVQNIGAYGTEVSEWIHKVNCYDVQAKEFITYTNKECDFTYRNSIFKRHKNLLILSVDFKLVQSSILSTLRKNFLSFAKQFINETPVAARLVFKSIRFGKQTNWRLKMNFEYVRQFLSLDMIPTQVKRLLVKAIRTKTMPNPKVIGNVGCFFKSPIVPVEVYNNIKKIDSSIGRYKHTGELLKVSVGDLIKSVNWNGRREGNVSVDVNRPLIILNHGGATGIEIFEFSEQIKNDVHSKFNIKIEPEAVILRSAV